MHDVYGDDVQQMQIHKHSTDKPGTDNKTYPENRMALGQMWLLHFLIECEQCNFINFLEHNLQYNPLPITGGHCMTPLQ